MALSFKVSKLEIIDEELEMGENNTCQGEILILAEEQSPTDQDTVDVFNKGKNILGKNRMHKHRKYDNIDEDNKNVARKEEDKRFESNEDEGRNDESRDKDMDGDRKYENKDVNNKAVNNRKGNNKDEINNDEDNKDMDNEDEPREKDNSNKEGDKKYEKKDKSNMDEDNTNGKFKDEANKDEIISEENVNEENKRHHGTNQNENYDHISAHEMQDILQDASISETGVSTEDEGFNIDHLKAKIYSAFSWDNFFYAIIFGLGPTAWDVFSDLRFGHHLTEAGDIHSAGLCYLGVFDMPNPY